MNKQEPAAWISKNKETGAEQLHRVPVQSIPAGCYEFTPLYREQIVGDVDLERWGVRATANDSERASWRVCLLVWFMAGAISWELLRHLVMAVARLWG